MFAPVDRKPNLNIDVHDSSFSSTSESAGSFSSAPSIFTPTSGRSSPLYEDSVPVDSCFSQSASFTYGYTPPSSLDAAQYPFSWDFVSATATLLNSAPSTPSKCNNNGNRHIFGPENPLLQYTPPNSSGFLSFHDPFLPSQFSPVGPVYPSGNGLDDSSVWSMLDSSPLQFSEGPVRSTPRSSVFTGSSQSRSSCPGAELVSPRQQIDLGQVHQKSAALQRVQEATRARTASRARPQRNPVEAPRRLETRARANKLHVAGKIKHWCPEAMCKGIKGYTRLEHLTRHINTFHLKKGSNQCPFCSKGFPRHDNFMTHLLLHVRQDSRGGPRVHYHPEALAFWEEEQKKCRPQAPSSRSRKLAESELSGQAPVPDKRPVGSRRRTKLVDGKDEGHIKTEMDCM